MIPSTDNKIKLDLIEKPTLIISFTAIFFIIPFITAMVCFFDANPPNIKVGVIGCIICVLTIFISIKVTLSKKITLELDPYSIKKTSKKGVIEIPWTEDHEVFYDGVEFYLSVIPVGTNIKTCIRTNNKVIHVEMVNNKFHIHDKILEYSFNMQHPIMKEKLNNSDTLQFGPISLDKLYIIIKGAQYRIEQLKEITVKEGRCIFNMDGKLFHSKIKIKEIPNFFCLYFIIKNK
jgi:hypothetical protein